MVMTQDKSFGFQHVSGPWEVIRVDVAAANAVIGVGDMLNMPPAGFPDRAAAGDNELYGVALDPAAANSGDTINIALVMPGQVWAIRSDGATARADVGQAADIVVADRDSNTLKSNMELDFSGQGTGTAQLKILGKVDIPGNDFGDTNVVLKVVVLEHFTAPAAQAGV